ncbi:MAG: SH3 domain-containing protein [Pseudomonadota bacterium]
MPRRLAAVGRAVLPCLLSLLGLLALAGCQLPAPDFLTTTDLPQDPRAFVETAAWRVDPAWQQQSHLAFRAALYAPWDQGAPQLDQARFAAEVAALAALPGYGENTLARGPEWARELAGLADAGTYPNAGWPGLTLQATDLRALPTRRPLVKGFAHPGQGLAFDRLQESLLPAGAPVFVAHMSRDGAWLFCDTAIGSFWLAAERVGRASQPLIRRWRTAPLAAILADGVGLKTADGRFLCKVDLGAVLPIMGREGGDLVLFAPDSCRGWATATPTQVTPAQAAAMPLALTPQAVAALAAPLMGQAYGWGGSFGGRDCSAFLRDLFAPFGIWLPRNSADQAKAGVGRVDLGELSPAAKEKAVLAQGVPFLTLLYLPGHIMLYLGPAGGRAAALHDLWGLRTVKENGKEGRWVVGRVVITDLWPGQGSQAVAAGSQLAERLSALTFLAPPAMLRP